MVLLHAYDGDRFLGQSLKTVEAEDWIPLMRSVTDTNVRVMQIIPINDDAAQRVQKTEMDVELASAPRKQENAPPPKAEPITSYDDLVLRAGDALVVLESSRTPDPQERVNAYRTVAILRDFALINLQRFPRKQADEAVRIAASR